MRVMTAPSSGVIWPAHGSLGSLGTAQTLHPSALHTILHGHTWSFCWVGNGGSELLKHFQVLLGTKSPICGWRQDCTDSGRPKSSKAWDISGWCWGELLDSSWTLQRSAPGTSSSIPFLFPILWVSPSSLGQRRYFGTWSWNQTRDFTRIRAKLWKNGLFIYPSHIFTVSWET